MKAVLIALFVFAASLNAQTPKSDADPLQSLSFLLGTWDAHAQGMTGAAANGSYTFRLELGNHILARHSLTSGCKGPADFDCEHGDLLYVYADEPGQALKAIYFDNEGTSFTMTFRLRTHQRLFFFPTRPCPGRNSGLSTR